MIEQALFLSRQLPDSATRVVEQHLRAADDLLAATARGGAALPSESRRGISDMAQHLATVGDDATVPRPRHLGDAPSAGHQLALRVTHGFTGTPDVISFVCSTRKTGVLQVLTETENFTIELGCGEVLHAHSSGAPTGARLGEILVAHGVLDVEVLERLLAAGGGSRLGTQLIEQGLATRAQLEAALETQIRGLFERLFHCEPREMLFWEGPPLYAEPAMRFNATMLLLEGARARDELHS